MALAIPDLRLEPVAAELPTEPPEEIWRDSRGEAVAHGWVREGALTMGFPGLGGYRFSAAGGPVTGAPVPGANSRMLEPTYWKSVVPFVLQARGYEVLHASAIAATGGVAAFCAISETGKSTLARALGRRGHCPWADDAVVLDGTTALPLPFQVKLRPESSEWFDEPETSRFLEPDREQTLRAIFVLERDESVDVAVRRVPPSAAFPMVLRHAFCFTLADAARKRAMIARYLDLASTVPVFELRFASGLERLDSITARIEETLAALN